MSLPKGWRPPHAHDPGRNPRHKEGLFDPIKADLTRAWTDGLRFLAEGYYWEAHEVLEAVWMAAAPNSAERALAQGVIQLANARLKARMGADRAAARLTGIARGLVEDGLRRGGAGALTLSAAAEADLRKALDL